MVSLPESPTKTLEPAGAAQVKNTPKKSLKRQMEKQATPSQKKIKVESAAKVEEKVKFVDGAYKIYVGNISKDTTEEELKDLFTVYGSVVEMDLVSKYKFAFVYMSEEQDAQAAISSLDGHEIHGQKLRVRKDINADECSQCGGVGHWQRECPQNRKEEKSDDDMNGDGKDMATRPVVDAKKLEKV